MKFELKKTMMTLLGVFALAAVSTQSFAQVVPNQKNMGVGVQLGEPTGITGKLWQDSERAWEAHFAYSFKEFSQMSVNYLFHFPKLLVNAAAADAGLYPYVGGGAVLMIHNSRKSDSDPTTRFGLRVPFGLEWVPRDAPIGVFVEFAPVIGIIPGTYSFFEAAVGGRLYF